MRRARLLIFVVAWAIAFVLVVALYGLFGHALQAMGIVLRALTISGVLVAVMTCAVMPVLVPRVMKWAASRQ